MTLAMLMTVPPGVAGASVLWLLLIPILAFPLIAPKPPVAKRIVIALLVAVVLTGAAVYAADAGTDVIVRDRCGSKLLLEIFGICT